MYIFSYKCIRKRLPYQDSLSYKVLPHAHNNNVFFEKSKFYNTFYKMSIYGQKLECSTDSKEI